MWRRVPGLVFPDVSVESSVLFEGWTIKEKFQTPPS
jgi:hypothetical protein